jgi:hypothetical protein
MTDKETEADLEARISATLAAGFPGVAIKHQRRFKVRLGHTEFEAPDSDFVAGRCDVLVEHQGDPLAVLELKREGLPLTADDDAQGWSYAALAGAPLVVISNGVDTRILLTHDRSILDVSSLDNAALGIRLRTAAQLGQEKVRGAIARLLGTNLASQAIGAINDFELGERTGGWHEDAPFVLDFLVPRVATESVRQRLGQSKPRAILVSGPPLCGKSSVLRELATTPPPNKAAVLYLDASACRGGVFRRLANVLSARFNWPASVDDARAWLAQLSLAPSCPFVICLDGPSPDNSALVGEIDEILAGDLGNIRLVLALDESDVNDWQLKPNRRESTRLGRSSEVITVENYDDDEFIAARNQLGGLGGGLVHGAAMAPELRVPWVLRAAVAPRMKNLPPDRVVVLPPLLGLESLQIAESRFTQLGDLRGALAVVARVHLEAVASRRPAEVVLTSLYAYQVRRERLRAQLKDREIRALVQAGLLLPELNESDETDYRVRVPILFAKLLSNRLFELARRKLEKEAVESVVSWLALNSSRLPFGDLIAADVVHRLAFEMVVGSRAPALFSLLNALVESVPIRKAIAAGEQWVALMPSAGLVRMELDENNNLVVHTRHSTTPFKTPVGLDDLAMVGNTEPWLILSQSEMFKIAFVRDGELTNVAGVLLMEVGQCPQVLRRVSKPLEGFHSHTIAQDEVVCGQMGIIEPITWATTQLLEGGLEGFDRTEWVKRAVGLCSLPLLTRIDRALSHMSTTQENAEWATKMLEEYSAPAWKHLGEEPPHAQSPVWS